MSRDLQKYMTRNRSLVEHLMSLFAIWWGWNVLLDELSGYEPVRWISENPLWWTLFPALFIGFGFLHGVGVFVNGSWKWSPLLRIIGLFGMVVLFGHLMLKAPHTTAFPTYTWVLAIYAYVLGGAIYDLKQSLGRAKYAGNN